MARYPLKRLPDQRAMLNLGCGSRMHWAWNNVDFSPIGRLRRHMRLACLAYRFGVLLKDRWQRLQTIDPEIVLHDLRNAIPFPDDSFDVVYHSHMLEHINRDAAPGFLRECRRVLKWGGIIRVVVSDLEYAVRSYLAALQKMGQAESAPLAALHEASIAELFEQMVRRENVGTRQQRPLVRFVERLVRGDARDAGELHRWMYDRCSLARLLIGAGFRDPVSRTASTSGIAGWSSFGLDRQSEGRDYKPGSLYIDGLK